MRDAKCVECGDWLKEEELPENKGTATPFPGFPLPKDYECFICFCKRADADSPRNLAWPTDQKEHEDFIKDLEKSKQKRRSVN